MVKKQKWYWGLFAALWLAGCAGPSLQRASQGVNATPALWQVQRGGEHTFYLFGSVHALPSSVKWYGPKLQQAYNKADELVFEVVEGQYNLETQRAYERKNGFLPKGKVVADYLNAKEHQTYQKIVKALKIKPYEASRMKPWLFMLVVNSVVGRNTHDYGVDSVFHTAAKREGKKTSGLESIQRFDSLSKEPLHLQFKGLKKMLSGKSNARKQQLVFYRLLVSWMKGDTDRTSRLLTQEMSKERYNSLIVKRNRKWYPKIKRLLKKPQSTLVVVGQAHLIGRGNVIQMLRRGGYKVKRVQ